MNVHYSQAVRSAYSGESPRELLESDVTVLVGVDEESKSALQLIGVENVHDLATSPVFEVARAVYETASSGAPSGGTERTTAMAAANRRTDGDLTDLAAADVAELEGIDAPAADDIKEALGVRTVRDLARWPPYRGARAILGALTGEGAETDDGIPTELVPTARKYATEQNFYRKVYIDRRLSEPDPEAPTVDGRSLLPEGSDGGDPRIIWPELVDAVPVVEESPYIPEEADLTSPVGPETLRLLSDLRSESDEESTPLDHSEAIGLLSGLVSESDEDPSDLRRTVVLDGTGRGEGTDYALSVTGSIETVDDETLPPGVAVGSNRADEVGESTARGRITDGAQGFRFSGRVRNLSLTDPTAAAVYVDGTRWVDGAPLDRTLVVEGRGTAGDTSYSIEVGGKILPVDGETLPPGVDVTWDRNDEADQDQISATVSTGADGFRFSGDIEEFVIADPDEAVVYLDGDEVEYPTTLGTTNISLSGSGRLDVRAAEESPGFEDPAVGGILQFSQKWVPQGLSLGQLLHSTTLAPGESTKVAVVDWSRRTRGRRQEAESQQERMHAGSIQNRSISEVQAGIAAEVQRGKSVVTTESSSEQKGGGVSGGLNVGPISIGGSHQEGSSESSAKTTTVSSSRGRRKVYSSMNQTIRNSTQQYASSSRTRRATVVRETRQEESEAVRTRVITNYNHMHALSVHYYEVVQIFRTEVAPEDAKPVLFVPFERLDFSDRTSILKHRQALKAAALDATTHHLLDVVAPRDDERFAEFSTDDRDRILVISGSDDEGTNYDLSVTRTLEPVDGESLAPGIDVTWDDADHATETTASGSVWEGADGFRFSGEIDTFAVEDRSAVDVYVDGIERIGPVEHDRTLVIDSRETSGGTNYRLEVGGGLEPVDDETLPPGVDVTWDDNDEARGTTASGHVRSGADGFRFSGPVETLDLEDPSAVTVYLDGEEWLATSEFVELVERLQENRTYYSQAVWTSLDQPTLAMMLEEYRINGRSAAEFVDPTPEATHGNLVAFPLSLPESVEDADDRRTARLAAWWNEWTDRNFDPSEVERDLVPLPTGGVQGEAILGRANSAEKLDITRFWDWQDSPIPQQAPQIAPVGTGSRAGDSDLEPSGFDRPIIQMQQPQTLPDPTGLGAVLETLGSSSPFRDMSGLTAAANLAAAANRVSGEGASHIADTAARTFAVGSRARVEQTKTLAEVAKALAGGGGFSAANANNSSFGAALNEAKRMDGTIPAGDGTAESSGRSSPSDGDGGSDAGGSSSDGRPARRRSDGTLAERSVRERMMGYETPAGSDSGSDASPSPGEGQSTSPPEEGQSTTPPPEGEHSFHVSISGSIPTLAQPSGWTCWATVTTMLLSWRDSRSYTIDEAMGQIDPQWQTKFRNNSGLSAGEKTTFLNDAGLESEPPATNYGISQIRAMIETYGPLWVTADMNPNTGTFAIHARIITAIWGDGTPTGTTVKFIDPAGGRTYTRSFQTFSDQFEEEITEPGGSDTRVQVVHWPEQ